LTVESPPIPLIDRFTGRRRGSLLDRDDNAEVVATAFSPDGRTLATLISRSATAGAGRAELQVWDVAHRTPVAREPLLARSTEIFSGALAFSPDGRRLAVVSDGGSMVFDLDVDHWAARACALSPTCSGRPGQAGR
jgi:WD40 repeat protein